MYIKYLGFYILVEYKFQDDLVNFDLHPLNHLQPQFPLSFKCFEFPIPDNISNCGELIEPPLKITSLFAKIFSTLFLIFTCRPIALCPSNNIFSTNEFFKTFRFFFF